MQFAHIVNDQVAALFDPGEAIVLGDEQISYQTAKLWRQIAPDELARRSLYVVDHLSRPVADVVVERPVIVGDPLIDPRGDPSIDPDSDPVPGVFARWEGRPFTSAERAAHRVTAKQRVKARAQQAIIALAPDWKQRNVIARGVELTCKQLAGDSLSAEEQAEVTAGEALWTAVKAIRGHSDTVETQIDAATTRTDIDDLVTGIVWP